MAKKSTLTDYRKKRDFSQTPEPSGSGKTAKKKTVKKKVAAPKTVKAKAVGRLFVIQKHDATRLHYDFRLEIGGTLKSWAVPKGPSMNPADKRLAVETEDHPIEYAKFEGVIPEGEYGGGPVMIWDTGKYYNLKVKEDGLEVPVERTYEDGRIEIWLEGKKLRGSFALVKTHIPGRQKQWLLIKMKDALAQTEGDITQDRAESVKTGRTIEEIEQE